MTLIQTIYEMRTHLDLFSGIGGFALAARWNGVRTVGFCEREPYAQQVLRECFLAIGGSDPRSRWIKAKNVLANPHRQRLAQQIRSERNERRRIGNGGPRIHRDIRRLDGSLYRGVWLITGGFPCQPYSVAGKRGGSKDDRALWPEMLRVINQSRPTWVLGENVPGLITMELDRCLSDLEAIGYSCRPFVVPACAVNAKHRRDRVWIVAHSDSDKRKRGFCQTGPQQYRDKSQDGGEAVADCNGHGLEEWEIITGDNGSQQSPLERGCRWEPEPNVGRVASRVPNRSHRLRGLGNAIVPQVAAEFIRFMIQSEKYTQNDYA